MESVRNHVQCRIWYNLCYILGFFFYFVMKFPVVLLLWVLAPCIQVGRFTIHTGLVTSSPVVCCVKQRNMLETGNASAAFS